MGPCLSTHNSNCCNPSSMAEMQAFCLSIPAVRRKIFHNFSNKELLQLSLVCKQWSSEARSILAKRGSLIAKLNPYSPHMVSTFKWPLHDLAAFASDLQRMDAAPISLCGINVKIGCYTCWEESKIPPGKLDPTYDVILDRIKWRNLAVTIGPFWRFNRNCQAIALVKRILQDKREHLVEITVRGETSLGESFVQEFLQNCSFSRLRTLKLLWQKFELDFVRALVSRAPRLEKLYTSDPMLMENIVQGSSVEIVPFWCFNPLEEFSPT